MHGEWEEDVHAFDDILTEILTLSDVLAAGIMKQFPDKFPIHAPYVGDDEPAVLKSEEFTPPAPAAVRWR